MQALGIPTTRALAVVATGETILREVDGWRHRCPLAPCLPGSLEPSHVGTFPLATGDSDLLRRLTDYTITRHADAADAEAALALLDHVVPVQADLVAGGVGGRLHPRGDEHRQRDHLGRDDRLRPCHVHGRL